MNRFLSAIAIASTLFLTQSCSSLESKETTPQSPASSGQMSSHSGMMGDAKTDAKMCKPDGNKSNCHDNANAGHSASGDSGGHSHGASGKAPDSQAKLTVPPNITPNKSVPVAIAIQDASGKAITNFEMFQEKLMHLIVVSNDLQFFNHLHPEYKENGRFEVQTSFPKSGGYTLFSDYKPAGQKERVSVLKAQVTGKASSAATAVNFNKTKTFGKTKVNLGLPDTVKAGKEVMAVFKLEDATNNKPVTDLQPYLGENGHLVIVRQSNDLKASDYIHAHPHGGTPASEVHFMTQFPKAGKYKLWGQFNRNGQIITADFWVNVVE